MKIFLNIMLAIFFICGVIMAGDEDVHSPKIVFEQEEFDFGVVTGDTVLTHVFVLTNTGLDTLTIKKINPS